MNKVILIGRLARDPDLRKTQSGQSFVRFTMAVNRNFKNANGETEADFISCIAWRNTADAIARFLNKGSRISVEGRIQTGSYEDSTGKRVYTTDIVCESFEFLDTRSSQQGGRGYEMSENQMPFEQTNNYQGNNNNSNNNDFNDEFSTDNTLDIASDDLPF